MLATSAKFKNHPCFKDHWSGLDRLPPVTLIIGKNNTGKSHLLHFVRDLCRKTMGEIEWDLNIVSPLDGATLKQIFRPGTSGGRLGGYHWDQHGVLFVNKTAIWSRESGNEEKTEIQEGTFFRDSVQLDVADERISLIQRAMPAATHLLHGKIFASSAKSAGEF